MELFTSDLISALPQEPCDNVDIVVESYNQTAFRKGSLLVVLMRHGSPMTIYAEACQKTATWRKWKSNGLEIDEQIFRSQTRSFCPLQRMTTAETLLGTWPSRNCLNSLTKYQMSNQHKPFLRVNQMRSLLESSQLFSRRKPRTCWAQIIQSLVVLFSLMQPSNKSPGRACLIPSQHSCHPGSRVFSQLQVYFQSFFLPLQGPRMRGLQSAVWITREIYCLRRCNLDIVRYKRHKAQRSVLNTEPDV